MTTLSVAGSLLAADPGARTVTYRLLPYGEQGRTSRGLVTASRGSVTIPEPSAVVLNMEHDRTRPVGRAVAIVEDASGLVATFSVAATTAGADLLAETAAGLRPGVSVELDDVVIRDGALVRSVLVAAGAVVAPAFPSALLVATDTDPETPDPETDPDADAGDGDTDDPDAIPGDAGETGDTAMPEDTVTAAAPAAAPAALVASAPAGGPTLPRVTAMLAALTRDPSDRTLMAALSDITGTAAAETMPPQWVAEIWSGSPYQRQIVPLLGAGTLTAPKVVGWAWDVKPVGAEYAGDKTDVASNAATTKAVEYAAQRWAGAHDVDRILRDFDPQGFWESYWAAMASSYGAWSDAEAAAGVLAGATVATPAGTGVVAALVAAALKVIPYGSPSYALLGAGAFAELVERDPMAFLSGSVSLTDATGNAGGLAIRASTALATDQVVVGVRNAATWYELGSTPIRAETVNIANGGIDVGAFGYGVVGIHDGRAIAKATVTVPVP